MLADAAITDRVNHKDDDKSDKNHQVDVSNRQRCHHSDVKPLLRVDFSSCQRAYFSQIASYDSIVLSAVIIIDSWHIQG